MFPRETVHFSDLKELQSIYYHYIYYIKAIVKKKKEISKFFEPRNHTSIMMRSKVEKLDAMKSIPLSVRVLNLSHISKALGSRVWLKASVSSHSMKLMSSSISFIDVSMEKKWLQ